MTLQARWCALLLLLLPGGAMADSPVTITPMVSFSGMAPRGGVYPIAVTLHNAGGSADGALIVKSESYSSVLRTYAYPVSLPTGTDKEIVVYPVITPDAESIDFSFDGNARADKVSLPMEFRDGTQVGMIGDEPGALSTLRLQQPTSSQPSQAPPMPYGEIRSGPTTYNDCYSRPEDAPDRAAGYQGMSYLVLGAGAERLRPEQWDAIRHWVMDGGSLILTGGAGATYLRVPEAAALLPISGLHDVTLPSPTLPEKVTKEALPAGPVALVSGTLQPGGSAPISDGSQPLIFRQSVGAGTVLLVGFNPLEEPFRDWGGQHDLWIYLLKQAAPSLSGWTMRQWSSQQTSFDETQSMMPGGVMYRTNGVDPFRIKLPPVSTIAWMLLAYFVLVVPVSFFILRKIKRLELAWFTSPLISICFAYAFYLFTAQLYSAGMSQRTAGIVVAAAGTGDAQFDGFSEMFIPRGGSYQITVPGAEAIELSPFGQNDNSYGYAGYGGSSQTNLQSLTTVDMGSVAAPNFGVGNLAFSRVYHTEPVSLGGPLTVSLARSSDGGFTGTVRNGTSYTFYGASIYEPGSQKISPIGDIQPQESVNVHRTEDSKVFAMNATPFGTSGVRHTTPGSNTAYFMARTAGETFGPSTMGKDVGGSSSVLVLISVPIAQGGPV